MAVSHASRTFDNGLATRRNSTIPTQGVVDSQLPSEADDAVTSTINGEQLAITPNSDGTDK